MDKFKKFLKALADYPKAVLWVVSGRAERDNAELRQSLEDLHQRAEETLQLMRDKMAFDTFKTRKASDYFNEAAAKHPDMADNYKRLATLAATVNLDKMRGDINAYPPEDAANKEWHVVRQRYAEEITRYVEPSLGEFAAQDAARWARLEKNWPELAGKAKPSVPPAPNP